MSSKKDNRMSLGDRVMSVKNAKYNGSETSPGPISDGDAISQLKRFTIVLLTLAGWLAIVNIVSYSVLEFVILERNPDLNTNKAFNHFENPYWDSVSETIPFIQDWYESLNIEETEIRNPLLQRDDSIKEMCTRAFYSTEFDVEDIENYDKFVNEESILKLSQTGIYKGTDGIAEYMGFTLTSSPYVDEDKNLESDLNFKRYDEENNICEFTVMRLNRRKTNKEYTRYSAEFDYTVMFKIFLDMSSKPVVSQMNAYLSEAFIDFTFGILLNSDKTRDFVCSVMKGPCEQPADNCEERLASQAVTDGELVYIDGNTQGCRALHAVFAEQNPNHCAHISFDPTPDPNGKIKCQESARINPASLFEDIDFENFKKFQISNGINPTLGYDESCEEGNFCDELPDIIKNQIFLSPTVSPTDGIEPQGCVDRLIGILQQNVRTTSPDHVEVVLQNVGLGDKFMVRDALKELLTQPQPLNGMYNESSTCLGSNTAVAELACIMEESGQWDSQTQKDLHVMEYLVNQAVVFESLTLAALDNIALLYTIVEVMTNNQRMVREDTVNGESGSLDLSEDTRENFVVTYRSAVGALVALAKSISENSNTAMMSALQLSILSGTKVDIENDFESNARVGLSLAAGVRFNPFVKDNIMKWKLSSNWEETYLAWSMANVWGSLPGDYLGPLMMPSISCSAGRIGDGDFVARRLVSQSLAIMHQFQGPRSEKAANLDKEVYEDIGDYSKNQAEDDLERTRYKEASALGTSNMKKVKVDSPSEDSVEKMLYALCGERCHDGYWKVTDTAPQSNMDHEQFLVYTGFISFMTMLIAGLGSELLMFVFYLQKYGWSTENQKQWKLAQFVFSLLLTTALGLASSRSFLALPFLVFGLWKFGFPETILFQYMALFDDDHSWIQRISDFLNGTGTVAHHGAAAMTIAMMVSGVITADRYALSPCLILVVQHWLVLVRYVNENLYIGIVLFVEFWFEWVIINVLEHNASNHWTAALTSIVMLVAHWQYLLAAGIAMIGQCLGRTEKRDVNKEMNIARESIVNRVDMKTARASVIESWNGLDLMELESLVEAEEEEEEEEGNEGKKVGRNVMSI